MTGVKKGITKAAVEEAYRQVGSVRGAARLLGICQKTAKHHLGKVDRPQPVPTAVGGGQKGFYRENDAGTYVWMGNGELRRKDMEAWRAQQRELGLSDTRADYQAIWVRSRKHSNRERGKECHADRAWRKMCSGGILARTTRGQRTRRSERVWAGWRKLKQ